MVIVLLVFFGGIAIIFLPIIRDTIRRKGRWGINPEKIQCPRCGEQPPIARAPTSFRQAAWGGWACSKCGCEIDKWGAEIQDANVLESAKPHEQIIDTKESAMTPVERILSENKERQ